ncbi:MAG: extradiol ring-cleavage dioxygenase [Chloroflexi bacterium]|nr:extradiol ring-cleavage dioxygenase [Chloroflexota bacterium]MYD48222.1 extradiol ring-cleavage dioxygenase [Chloroflexota bacterium]
MAEILGLGLTHSPSFIRPDEDGESSLKRTLRTNDNVPAEMKNPSNWPEPMRIEYGEDEGYASAVRLRERMVAGFRKLRQELDAFNPDFVVIWGDDQYENFREDIIPPFCVLAYDEFECKPFGEEGHATRRNVWNEPAGTTFKYRGHKQGARDLVSGMIDRGVDMAYAYQPLHEPGLGHAILNTILYLDYDRKGFDYPVVPMLVNCYGSRVIRNRGGSVEHSPDPDPPGPSPKRCMQIGKAAAQAIKESPYRVALIASSSWSHAFLTEKHHWLYPDIESDRARFAEMKDGDYRAWARISTAQIEDAGQQELLNWACLVGAVDELDYKAEVVDWYETYIFNSTKCLAVFR